MFQSLMRYSRLFQNCLVYGQYTNIIGHKGTNFLANMQENEQKVFGQSTFCKIGCEIPCKLGDHHRRSVGDLWAFCGFFDAFL